MIYIKEYALLGRQVKLEPRDRRGRTVEAECCSVGEKKPGML